MSRAAAENELARSVDCSGDAAPRQRRMLLIVPDLPCVGKTGKSDGRETNGQFQSSDSCCCAPCMEFSQLPTGTPHRGSLGSVRDRGTHVGDGTMSTYHHPTSDLL